MPQMGGPLMNTTVTQEEANKDWLHYNLAQWFTRASALYLGGAIISLLGFVLPWFKIDSAAQWTYNGWHLMTGEGLPWIGLLFVGYAVLIGGGNWLLRRSAA